MTADRRVASPTSSSEMRPFFDQLHDEAIWITMAAFCAFGLVLIQVVGQYRDPSLAVGPCLTLYGLVAIAFVLRGLSREAAAFALVVCGVVVSLLLVAVAGMSAALILLILPAALAALLITIRTGILTAAAITILLIGAPATLLSSPPELRAFTVLSIWIVVGLVWLTLRPLLTILEWSWSSYEQNRQLLDQSRDHQVQLKQALEDLADANIQLTRLNLLGQRLQQEADDARRAKEEFVANVSHELRTPLNMIIGFSEMIVNAPRVYGGSGGRIPPSLLADLAVILRNSQHLSGLIDDVLDLSQIEAKRMALTKERVSLIDVFEAAAVAVRPLFDSKGLALKTEVVGTIPAIFCDRTRIREVILNLLSNAGRFTERGGVIVRCWREAEDVLVSVTDTGPGIGADDVGKVFQPFQQLDASIARQSGGSGLGLSISKAFVELHGGTMWLESQPGRGTSFFFRLPIDPPVPVDRGSAIPFRPEWEYVQRTHPVRYVAPVVRPRLAVVEEGNVLRRLLRRYLDGVEIVEASGLSDAINPLDRAPAHAVVVNDVSTEQALRRLDAAALPHGMTAIACSFPEPQQAMAELGIDNYLVKPIARERLLSAVDQVRREGRTILVVDDEAEARRLFQRMLASAGRGYRVLEADDGEHALAILASQRPDVILLDLAMPQMDGFHFLEARSRNPSLKAIPVVVISARDPAGQPIVSRALAVTRGGGLAMPQLLACVEIFSKMFGGLEATEWVRSADSVPTENPGDLSVSG